jgi:hypothetical protein
MDIHAKKEGSQFRRLEVFWLLLRVLIVSLIFTLLNSSIYTHMNESSAAPKVKVGDYIVFGSYASAPIVWRVIHQDANGQPIIFADKIIDLKPFDIPRKQSAERLRMEKGGNYYPDSNIRQWLNSSLESGFLSNFHFSAKQRALIRPYTHRVVLAPADARLADGGSKAHEYRTTFPEVVQNYDQSAYYKKVTDKVFLLSVNLHE